MPIHFISISDRAETAWSTLLSQVLAPLGQLEIVSEREALEAIASHQGRLIVIVDATVIADALSLVSRLAQTYPGTPIVVATASPTWQRARDAYKAGAYDYVPKWWDPDQLRAVFQHLVDNFLGPDTMAV